MKNSNKQKESVSKVLRRFVPPLKVLESETPMFRGEWDAQGVYVYQAYKPEIADWALENQKFGGPSWKPTRMTWIKPSFAWMLYRSGYGMKKSGQTRVLKIKLSHETIGYLLSHCKCVDTNKDTRVKNKQTHEGGGNGRVQWDPDRDLFHSEKNEPRRMVHQRAIQIGLSGPLSEYYVDHILFIQEVTDLAHQVGAAHKMKKENDTALAMEALRKELPNERPYLPDLTKSKLQELGMLPGPAAEAVQQIGRGRVEKRPAHDDF